VRLNAGLLRVRQRQPGVGKKLFDTLIRGHNHELCWLEM
jgi:hypothetical protein